VTGTRFNWSATPGDSLRGRAGPFDSKLFFPQSVDPANALGGHFMNGGVSSGFYLGKNVANSQTQ